jgi:hypothetical protein
MGERKSLKYRKNRERITIMVMVIMVTIHNQVQTHPKTMKGVVQIQPQIQDD